LADHPVCVLIFLITPNSTMALATLIIAIDIPDLGSGAVAIFEHLQVSHWVD
jgi:hypothetical protein